MFPIRDENPRVRPPVATVIIIGLNIAVWLFIQGGGSVMPLIKSFCLYSLIPGDLLGTVPPGTVIPLVEDVGCVLDGKGSVTTLITHAFLHGSWFHIISNLWFLWIFGDNVEDSMGWGRFIIFYLACTIAAAGAQIASDPAALTPMVGASGAIGGVMGAYARLYPRASIYTLIPIGFFLTTAVIPAVYMLGLWFFIQLLSSIFGGDGPANVAFWAHGGGFLAGLILIGPMHRRDYLNEHRRLNPEK
ncbi:rhomboid family intramembrane serine protease [Methylobacter sp. Wu1]|jgi:membrane associated rhomboid family serine protease|uniref:rhomboid family intramembrane serine protease n=1 Tax=Methylobacter sp. Wu1 TaxID=3119359 RepID=UPI002F93118E